MVESLQMRTVREALNQLVCAMRMAYRRAAIVNAYMYRLPYLYSSSYLVVKCIPSYPPSPPSHGVGKALR